MAMYGFRRIGLGLMAFGLVFPTAYGVPVTQSGHPDFSQSANANWANYCAPTAGTNVAYYFGQTYSILYQGNPLGPGAAADNGATDIIGGLTTIPPGPPATSMAGLMSTDKVNGTSLLNMASGLDGYLEANDGQAGSVNWQTDANLATDFIDGADFWTFLKNESGAGSGILLSLQWIGGSAPTGYDSPENTEGTLEGAMAHAVTMVGYDVNDVLVNDPANNGGAHIWSGEYAVNAVTTGVTDITISNFNGTGVTAQVYGAVVTSYIPEPSAVSLMLLGGVWMLRRRR